MANLLLVGFVSALAAVVLGLFVVRLFDRRRPDAVSRGLYRDIEALAFLFRDKILIDATAPARAMLASLPGDSDWQRLMAWLAMRFPDAGPSLLDMGEGARVELTEDADRTTRLRLLAEDLGERTQRITLSDPLAEGAGITVNSMSFAAMEHELELLRSTMDNSPMLAWREDPNGQVTWANSAYLAMADAMSEGETVWPFRRLIEIPPASPTSARRVQIEHDGHIRWYECHVHAHQDQNIAIALPADAAVRAERSLREFVQTLTKTFADLPIGLAIFDRDRNLQLFNPALIDLTGLAAGFLTGRPTLHAFLDRLREARMVPEPKDYRSWRNEMNSLEAAAASGHHVQTWSLPGGQTYRVTGRPHHDGALAFLFEDITAEILLTRQFRADLSLGSEVLNALGSAVAVFAAQGQLLMSNRSFNALWDIQPEMTLDDCLARWSQCNDGPGLRALRDALNQPATDIVHSGALAGPRGGLLSWTLRNLTGGSQVLEMEQALPFKGITSPQPSPFVQDVEQRDRERGVRA